MPKLYYGILLSQEFDVLFMVAVTYTPRHMLLRLLLEISHI